MVTCNQNRSQGVKECRMLAHIGCFKNYAVFSPFKLKVTANIWMPLKCTLEMGICTSKYALNFKFPDWLPTKSMVTEGQPMVTRDKQWWTFEVLKLSTMHSWYNCSKYALNFNFSIITHLNQWLLWATNGNQGSNSWWTFEVLRLSDTHKGYNTSKYALNFKFPMYHQLNQWLLGATNGN